MRGYLTVKKVYEDRVEIVPVDHDNTVTDGFGIAITNLLTSSPFRKMRDFQLGYWAAGSGTHYDSENYSDAQPDSVRNCLYELASPVSSVDGYGLESTIRADEGSAITVETKWVEDKDVVYTTSGGVFAKLPPQNVTTIEGDAIRVKLNLDREGLVGQTLREFGLYIANPEGHKDEDLMILAAYKPLMEPIEKTNEFSIDLEWVIDFANSDFFSDKIAESIYWYPTVKGVEPGDQFTKALSSGDLFIAQVETLNPVQSSGLLVFSSTGDAVEGVHYSLTASSLLFTPGEQKMNQVVRNIGEGYFTPKTLKLHLLSYSGDRNIADKFYYGKPSTMEFVLTSSATAPQLEFDSATIADTTQTILLDSSSTEEMTVYLEVSSNGGTYNGPYTVTIPSGVTSHDFTIDAVAGFDYIVSAHNPVAPTYGRMNRVGNSVNFDSHEVLDPLLGYRDVSSSPGDFDSPNDRRYRNFVGGPSYFHVGNQRTKDYQTSTTYTADPPQPFILKTLDASGPLPYGGSQVVYVPKEYYVWPGSDYAAPYITESRVPLQVDGLGRSSGMQVERFPYDVSSATTWTLSMFVRDFGTATLTGVPDEDDTIASSKYFTTEVALGNGSYVRMVWEWNSGVVSPLVGTSNGLSVGSTSVDTIGGGWYRVAFTAAGFVSSYIGEEMSYKVYPHVLDSGTMVDTSVPVDVSGTMMAGLMFEQGPSADPYYPAMDCFNTPIGGVRTNNSGQTETRFTL